MKQDSVIGFPRPGEVSDAPNGKARAAITIKYRNWLRSWLKAR